MPYLRALRWFAVSLSLSCFPAVSAFAETIELVTYYPAPASAAGNLNVTSLAINYPGTTPATGTAIISGPVGIGTTAPTSRLHIVSPSQIVSDVRVSTISNTAANGSQLNFQRERGDGVTRAAVTNLDSLGSVHYQGYDTAAIAEGARLEAQAEANWSTTSHPTRLQFFTTAAASITVTERMRIAANGNVGIGTNDPQAPLQVGASNLFVQNDQGGSIELGGTGAIANPVVGGMPYIDFHFGRAAGVVEDFNARLVNRADGILDVQTSTGGAAAQPRLSIGNNIGVGTITPQTTSPGPGNAAAGNLDANDVFIRSRNLWVSQIAGVDIVVVKTTEQTSLNTTLVAVSDLTFTTGLNETWIYEFHVFFFQNISGDSRWRLVCSPAASGGAWIRYCALIFNQDTADNTYHDSSPHYGSLQGTNFTGTTMAHNVTGLGGNDPGYLLIRGTIYSGSAAAGAARTINLEFSRGANGGTLATATVVRAGSFLRTRRVS